MHGARSAQCPNCGGPIAFGLASSAALVCPHCRYAVVRTDRDLRTLGRVADLVPTSPPLQVGDSGTIGREGFRVAGRMQLDHGRGPWDEWYLAFDDGAWGWLAQAQGHWYLTKPTAQAAFPTFEQMRPGEQGALPPTGAVVWTVSEQGTSTVLSAEGELPFPALSGQAGRYVDLVGPSGAFATLDYGDGSDPPQLFAGRQLAHDELQIAHTAVGPRAEQQVTTGKLECPSCGGPVPIQSPDAERAACSYCYALLDFDQGNLRYLDQLKQPQLQPLIPLGSQGTLDGEKLLVIGFMERFTVAWGVTYAWREYLLYGERGYSWLLEDNGHWTFLKPVSPADVVQRGDDVLYGGRRYRSFQSNPATVRFVVGEFYWKVQIGEQTHARDFIAPPRILSQERSASEITCSEGRYVEPREVWRAFGLSGSPPRPRAVAPAQPNPHSIGVSFATLAALLLAFAAVALVIQLRVDERTLVQGPLQLPATPARAAATAPTEDRASYTPSFTVTGGPTTLSLELETTANNHYVGVGCALINEETGEVRELFTSAEYYAGVTAGESWTDGSRSSTVYIDQVDSGTYTLRLDPEWTYWAGPFGAAPHASPPTASIKVTQGARSPWCCGLTLLLLLLPFPLTIYRHTQFEARRRG